jgi:nicotinic acid mononucleotide adenylyltransferase/nicotinamide mononucleotide (NMN) deamidase PncC
LRLEGSDWTGVVWSLPAKPQALGSPLISSDSHALVGAIFASGRQVVIAITGGGSGAISALVQTPGASRVVLEATVPYSLAALVDWIGGTPDQACSAATARAMAMAAFVRARELAPEADSHSLVGVGFTGSLATDRVKRGERRIHLAAQTADCTEVHTVHLDESTPTRIADEACSESMLLRLIAHACGVELASVASDNIRGSQDVELAGRERSELLLGTRRLAVLEAESAVCSSRDRSIQFPVVFPGAFNPPHVGHLRMAAIAEARLGRPAAWELSIANVDKPPLDFIAMRERVAALRTEDDARPIALTRAATFREKAELFPGAVFVVGADTIERVAEPRYYGGDATLRDAALAEIARLGCRFLVFGREVINGKFMTLGDLNLPVELHRICDEVPPVEFREDVSSTALRRPQSS